MAPILIDPSDAGALVRYLRARAWLAGDEPILDIGRAGAGNMNLTLRVVTPHRRFVLKQARPWVEKYPHIPAPPGRAAVEASFYELLGADADLARMMPRLLGFDPEAWLLLLEDLSPARDLTGAYAGEPIPDAELDALIDYLSALHSRFRAGAQPERFANREMRALNHEHLFVFPLAAGNGLDLEAFAPGLEAAAASLRADAGYVSAVSRLGDRYLADGSTLVHGDYFPGSWLRTGAGMRIIDFEFGFFGPPELDVGMMAAHLAFAHLPGDRIRDVVARYDGGGAFDAGVAAGFAGVELMRRLIGVAQLPLQASSEDRLAWLQLSRTLIKEGSWHVL